MPKPISKLIKILILGDVMFNIGWGFLGPVFALFILDNIAVQGAGEAAKIAGFASLIYWFVKSALQIPIGRYLDKNHGEKDDLWSMIIGLFLTGLTPLGFLISSQPWHIYASQVLHAVGMAMFIPSFLAVFSRHIDKGEEAFEWGLKSTFLGLGIGTAGALGGILAARFGFSIIFILASLLSFTSSFLLLLINKDVIPKDQTLPKIPRFKIQV